MSSRFGRLTLIACLALTPSLTVGAQPPGGGRKAPDDTGKQARTDRYGDPLPPGAIARLGTLRFRHGGPVFAVAFAADGKRIASAGLDGAIHIWDVATGRELRRREDELFSQLGLGAVDCLTFSPDGRALAVAQANRPPYLWDTGTGEKLRDFGGPKMRARWITFSPDGKLLAFISDPETTIVLADTETGKEARQFQAPAGVTVHRCTFSPDGKLLAAVGSDRVIRLWEVMGNKPARILSGHEASVVSVTWSADGKTLVSEGSDRTIRLWDVSAGKVRRKLISPKGKPGAVFVLLSADGQTLISSAERSIHFWKLAAGEVVHTLRPGRDFHTLALSPDGKVLASGGSDHTLRLWEVPTGRPLSHHPGPSYGLRWARFSPDGRAVATGGPDQKTRLWEAATGRPLGEIDHVGPSAFMPDGKALVSGGWADGKLRVWDAATSKELRQFATGQGIVFALAVSPDGRTLATASEGVRVWDPTTGRQIRQLGDPKSFVTQLAFSPDGSALATLHYEERLVRLYDWTSGKPIRAFKAGTIGSFAFSPEGKLLAATEPGTAGQAPFVRLWDVATGEEVRRLPGHADPLDAVAFSPDGRTLFWGGQDQKVVRVWEVATGQQRRQLLGHQGRITRVTFSADGSRAASASADGTVLIWDANGPLRAGPQKKAVPLTPADLRRLWDGLAGEIAVEAYEAMARLAGSPAQAVELLRERLPPVPTADPRHVARWLADLGSDQFRTRERAAENLQKLGAAAEPGLRKALEAAPSLEARRRLSGLLARLDDPARRLQMLRALELLEHLGTPEASAALKRLAGGAPRARLTEEARAALTRLANRPAAAP